MNFKIILGGFFAIATMGSAIPQVQAARQAPVILDTFCTRFSTASATSEKRIAEKDSRLEKTRAERAANLAKKRADNDAKLAEARSKADIARAQDYQKLLARGDTDAKKKAIENFKSTVEGAIKTRRSDVDGALRTFRTSADAAVKTHNTQTDSALNTFKAGIDAATSEARSECGRNLDAKIVRQTYTTSVTTAKNTLQKDRAAIPKIGQQLDALATVRRTSIETAFKNFRSTLEQAKTTLKAALK